MSSVAELEGELRIASRILEWEIGDIWGHVGVRVPRREAIAVKLFRADDEGESEKWIVHFDHSFKRLFGAGQPPGEAAIYTELFKARTDVTAVVHAHAPMCIALSMANRQVEAIHIQSKHFAGGVPIFPRPIFIVDESEGAELARTLGKGPAVVIRGHGVVTAGRTIKEACMYALYLERTAKMQAVAAILGFQGEGPEFMDQMNQSVRKLRGHVGEGTSKDRFALEWRYYKRKVERGEYWSRGWV